MASLSARTPDRPDARDATSGLFASTAGRGHAGAIMLDAPRVEARDGGIIRSDSNRGVQGNAGDIILQVDHLILTNGGQILARALNNSRGRGGDISIIATDSVTITGDLGGVRSGIVNSTRAVERLGDITVQTKRLTLAAGGRINAASRGSGAGGTITITADSATFTGRSSDNGESGLFSAAGEVERAAISSSRQETFRSMMVH